MMSGEQGVVVPLTEIYKSQQMMTQSIQEFKLQLERIEQRISVTSDADERSREALEIAKEAKSQSKEALDRVKKNDDDRRKFHQTIWLSAITQVFPYILIGIGYLAYYSQKH